MNRILILAVAISWCSCNQQTPSGQTESASDQTREGPPNIVVILADDMGFGDIQAYNPASKIPTPNLNKLCEQGMAFRDAHTNSAVCTPTRYGLLTGRYAWRTRLKKHVLSGYSQHLIDPTTTTIASLVKSKGYQAGVVGKWHLGMDLPWNDGFPEGADNLNYLAENQLDYTKPVGFGPSEFGFDYSFIIPGSLDMGPYIYLENGQATAVPDSVCPKVNFPAFIRSGEIAPDFDHQQVLDKLTEKATAFIREQASQDNPFLLYFPLTGPHKPALAAERFEGKSGFGPYGDLVMQVDWTVGEVMKTLDALGIADNTLLLYTSDNGSYMFRIDQTETDHLTDSSVQGFHPSSHQSNHHWRGTKADIFDGGHRVPFIVRWPGQVAAGTTSDRLVCTTDIFATVADLTGINMADDQGPDSFSFKSVLLGGEGFQEHPIVHHSVNGTFSVRQGPWKMIFSDGSGGRQQPVSKPFQEPYQLYNLAKDPSEQNDLINEQPEVAESLQSILDQIMNNPGSRALF